MLPGDAHAAIRKPVQPGHALMPTGYGGVGPVKENGEQEMVTLHFH